MKNLKRIWAIAMLLPVVNAYSQSFTNSQALIPQTFNSGGCTGVADMDGDGLDDVMILDQSRFLYIAYQEPNGTFSLFNYGSVSGSSQWGACAADFDQDGHKDVFSGGSYDGVKLQKIAARGVNTSASPNNGSMFMQATNFADIDNDGFLDVFACHDDAVSRTWRNDQNGNLVFDGSLMALTSYDYSAFPNTDHSGNYGTVWSDFDDDGDLDLYIAKCRQGVSNSLDPRRINQLWVNDGNGNYTEDALNRGLVLYQQSWTADFGDVDNDGDLDCLVTNHTSTMKLLQNDGNGYFTDVTATAGVGASGFFLQAKMADLDNDGYVDILYSGGVHGYYHNDGDGTFTLVPNTFPYGNTMHSFGIGDLNNDGHLDVYASYGNSYVSPDFSNPDILWLNNGNNNNWVSFDLTGTFSNLDAVGAKVKLYGPWGVQVREVRAGESYGITNSFKCHFGIGSNTAITNAEIIWPSGTVTNIPDPAINVVHNINEAPCIVSAVEVLPAGEVGFCPGSSVELAGPAGFASYQWSNGSTSSSIQVSTAGVYTLQVTDGSDCVGISSPIVVFEIVPESPEVFVDGPEAFCEGLTTMLSTVSGDEYLWSNGATTQSIEVGVSGEYSVQVTDVCGNVNLSAPKSITVFAGPPLPDVSDVVLPAPGQATFNGTSPDLRWYDSALAVTPIATGSSYQTPVINTTTTYWVEDVLTYGGTTGNGGLTGQLSGAYHTNSNNYQLFDIYEPVFLRHVKVFANGAGNRTIELIDNLGQTVHIGTFNIPNGESFVQLDWYLEPGTGYGLRTTDSNPQLWRDAPPSTLNYPYDLGGLGAITSSSIVGANQFAYYYFFYDWLLETPSFDCVGERIPVQAIIGVEGCTDISACNYDPNANVDDGSCNYDCDCAADFNLNGTVGTDDLILLLTGYGCTPPDNCSEYDLNGDAAVNSADLIIFLSAYGSLCI